MSNSEFPKNGFTKLEIPSVVLIYRKGLGTVTLATVLTLFASIAVSSAPVWAQQSVSAMPSLPVIEVTAMGTSRAITTTPATVDRIDLRPSAAIAKVNLSEVLHGVPALQINNRENYAQDLQLSMRGFGARATFGVRGIRMYVDGIPATMPDGQGQTSNIDMHSLSQVEVLTGPFAALYGNASGGALLMHSREGQGRNSIEFGFNGGSHDKQQGYIQAQGGRQQATEPAYMLSSSYFQTDGYREHSAAQKVLHNAKLTWNLSDGSKINWVTNRVELEADDPAGLTRQLWKENPQQQTPFLKQFNVHKSLQQTQTGVTWHKPLGEQQSIDSLVYMGNRQLMQYQAIPRATQANPRHAGGVIDFDRDYYGADLRWNIERLWSNVDLSVGVALDHMQDDRQSYENFNTDAQYGVKGALRRDEVNTLWNIDPYLKASWQFLPSWQLDASWRYSNVHYRSKDRYITATNPDDSGRTDYQKVLPALAVGWDITPQLYSYMSYGKGFETPTFTEMAYSNPSKALNESSDNTGGMNFDLKPASSDRYEWGLKSNNAYGLYQLAIFHIQTENDIVASDAYAGRATFRNAERTLRQGVELSWRYDLWKDLKVSASYAYLDASFDADLAATLTKPAIAKGTRIPGIAKQQAFASVAWQPEQGLHAGMALRHMDRIYVDDVNSDFAPRYTIAALHVGYLWQNNDWTLNGFARVDNLFDRHYVGSVIVNDGNRRFFEPADGRNWQLGASIQKRF